MKFPATAPTVPNTATSPIDRLALKSGQHYRRTFTLIELMIVLVIIGLVMALVIPKVGRLPAGLVLRTTVGQFRSAFRDAATRARATGVPVKLIFDTGNNRFRLEEVPESAPLAMAGGGVPAPVSAPIGKSGNAAGGDDAVPLGHRYSGSCEYDMPKGIEWHLESWNENSDETPFFVFFPNGEATGGGLEFTAGRRLLRLDIDRLTGRPLITEKER